MNTLSILFIITALLFDYLNGFHDSANMVATVVSSRAMSPRKALIIVALAEMAGPLLFGVAVATTIGHDLITPEAITIPVIMTALVCAIVWNLITWYFGLPSSSSHALVGGLVGAVMLDYGRGAVEPNGLTKVLLALVISPILGLLIGYILMKIVLFLARAASPKINFFFKRAQILTVMGLAMSHGSNDAQKTMGIITMGLLATGYLDEFRVPWWVILISATAISLGIMTGGWRLIKTLGGKIYKIRPVHGFTSQLASATVILGAAMLGGPVSTTQVTSTAIMGVGAAERVSKVRWGVAQEIVGAWVLTIPATMLLAVLLYIPVRQVCALF